MPFRGGDEMSVFFLIKKKEEKNENRFEELSRPSTKISIKIDRVNSVS